MSDVLVHDDDCDEVLVDGYCNRCRFAPDGQSIARVDVRRLLREMPTLRARLAECERERDEAVEAGRDLVRRAESVSRALNDAGWPSSALGWTWRACDALRSLKGWRDRVVPAEKERDAAIQRAADLQERIDALCERCQEGCRHG